MAKTLHSQVLAGGGRTEGEEFPGRCPPQPCAPALWLAVRSHFPELERPSGATLDMSVAMEGEWERYREGCVGW